MNVKPSSVRCAQFALCLTAALGGAIPTAAEERASPPLHAIDLGTLGGHRGEAVAINEAGMIVGTDTDGREGREPVITFYVPPNGKLTRLRDFAGAADVDPRGTVVGTIYSPASRSSMFLWREGDGYLDPPSLPAARRIQGIAIDRTGRVVATSETYPEPGQSWICEPAPGLCAELPGKPGLSTHAVGMSPSGAVVGYLREVIERGVDEPNIVNEYPVFWDASTRTLHELPSVLGEDGVRWRGEATDMNDSGTIVGTLVNDGKVRAVAWAGPDHALRVLGDGHANAVNAHDVVVGAVPHPEAAVSANWPRYLPHLWDLRSGASLSFAGFAAAPTDVFDGDAMDINDRGVAVGRLSSAADDVRASRAVVFERYTSEK